MTDLTRSVQTAVFALAPETVQALDLYGDDLGVSVVDGHALFEGDARRAMMRLAVFIQARAERQGSHGSHDEWVLRAKGAMAPLYDATQILGTGLGATGRVIVSARSW
jgi:hypothetical protein